MSFFDFMLGLGVLFIFMFLIVLYFVPHDKRLKQKALKEKGLSNQRDWQQKAALLERKLGNLKHENEQWWVKCQKKEEQIAVYKEAIRKLKNKLKQEKVWFSKEQHVVDKRIAEYNAIKEELAKAQEDFNSEHARTILLEAELKELKNTNKSNNDARRLLEAETTHLKEKIQEVRRDMAHLKKDNIDLKRKHEDTQWVAKADYLRVDKLLREKEKELARLSREAIKKKESE